MSKKNNFEFWNKMLVLECGRQLLIHDMRGSEYEGCFMELDYSVEVLEVYGSIFQKYMGSMDIFEH